MKKINRLSPSNLSAAFASMLSAALMLVSPVLAVPLNDVNSIAANNGLARYSTFREALQLILRGLLTLAFTVAVIFVVIAGYQLVTARGNEDQIAIAKKNLTWAVIGIVIIAASWIVLSLILTSVVSGNP